MSSGPVVFIDGRVRPRGLSIYEDSGFILMLDALGTKGIWKILEPEVFYKNWDEVNHSIDHIIKSNPMTLDFDIYSFSDTLIVPFKWRDFTSSHISFLGLMISKIIQTAFFNNVLLRGSLSVGTFYKSHKFVIGPAVDDAANCYEEADIIGIIASNSFNTILETAIREQKDVFPFVKSVITSKDVDYRLWTLNWNYPKNHAIISNLKERMNKYDNKKIVKKYRNTIDLLI